MIEAHDAFARQCRASSADFACVLAAADHWHPCDPPRGILQFGLPPGEPVDHSGLIGKFFFDGQHCTQATAEDPGPCASLTTTGMTCQDWTTREACEAARALCAERGR